MIPTSIIRIWFLGLFSWVLLGLGFYFSHRWYYHAWSYDFNLQRSYFDPHFGYNFETLLLLIAACLLFWISAGGLLVRVIFILLAKAKNPKAAGQLPDESQEASLSRLDRQMDANYTSNVMAGKTPRRSF
jgi:hypothetical protein